MIATTRQRQNGDSSSNSNSAFYALVDRVQSLNFRAFQMCVMLWLGAKGLSNIRPLGRHHRRGRRLQGGAEFLAETSGSRADVAIQIRHWNSPIQRRAVDELWGFMLRRGVPLGLIVTNSRFMKSAEKAALEYPGRPIQLVSVRQLCSSMAALELGLAKVDSAWILDESFFRTIDRLDFAHWISKLSHVRSTPALGRARPSAGLGGELDHPENRPPTLTVWAFLAAAILTFAVLLWLKLGGSR